MAHVIRMIHVENGLRRKGYEGFSWTTLFFGPFPSLFRGDLKAFLISSLIGLTSMFLTTYLAGIGMILFFIVWSFLYNGY